MVFAGCFFATLELASRLEQWFLYKAPILGVYTYDSALFTIDEFGIRGKANGAYEKWRLNSFGFRGPEIQQVKAGRRLRVICVGASETFGLYESAGKEWPRQLEQVLNRSELDAEVINAALAGMSLSQRIGHLENRLLAFSPDVVVFMLEYGSYAGLTPERMRVPRNTPRMPAQEVGIIGGLGSLRVIGRIKDVVIPKLPVSIQEMVGEVERTMKLRTKQRELGEKFRSFTHVEAFEVAAFKEALNMLAMKADAAGVKLVLVSPAMWMTPRNIEITYLSWPFIDESWWREGSVRFPRIAQEFAKERGIAFVDLSAIVQGHEPEYMVDMLHFNDRGAEQVAQHMARTIVSQRPGLLAQQGSIHVQ